jgi:hypothetical protein
LSPYLLVEILEAYGDVALGLECAWPVSIPSCYEPVSDVTAAADMEILAMREPAKVQAWCNSINQPTEGN